MAARKWETGESSPQRRKLEQCVKAACHTTGAMALALARGQFDLDNMLEWAASLRLVADAIERDTGKALDERLAGIGKPDPAQRAPARLGTRGEQEETPLG